MEFVVPQSCVEPPFAFEFTCARHWSVPLFAAAWLEGVPCLSVAIISAQRSAHLGRDLFGVPRIFREAISGNRRKQTETGGNRRKHTEPHGPSSLLRRVVSRKIHPKIKIK